MEKDLGRLIREMREARGMSLKTLAERLDVSARHVHRLEDGEGLTVTSLLQISKALGVPLSDFADKSDASASADHPGLPADEAVLLELYRGLSNNELKRCLIGLLKCMRALGSG
jgi:transcriptional regulator with XRE-family HTH domain